MHAGKLRASKCGVMSTGGKVDGGGKAQKTNQRNCCHRLNFEDVQCSRRENPTYQPYPPTTLFTSESMQNSIHFLLSINAILACYENFHGRIVEVGIILCSQIPHNSKCFSYLRFLTSKTLHYVNE